MHSNNHKFHNRDFACLGLDLRLQIKKLRFKRWFCTVFQESTCYCVTWKIKDFFVQNWFLTMLYSFFCNLYLVWGTHKKYHDNIRSLLQGKQPQYRLKFNKMLLCDICGLIWNIPLAGQTAKDTLLMSFFLCCKVTFEKEEV